MLFAALSTAILLCPRKASCSGEPRTHHFSPQSDTFPKRSFPRNCSSSLKLASQKYLSTSHVKMSRKDKTLVALGSTTKSKATQGLCFATATKNQTEHGLLHSSRDCTNNLTRQIEYLRFVIDMTLSLFYCV